MTKSVVRCENCRFYRQSEPSQGKCHLNPPAVVTPRVCDSYSQRAVVASDDFCSHFKIKALDTIRKAEQL